MGVPLMIAQLGTKIVGGIAKAGAVRQQYGAVAANSAYQAQVASNNAQVARQKAEMERQAGEIRVGQQGLKTRAIVGKTKAEQGASGVDVNTGSFRRVREAEAELGMVDALTLRSEAAKRAWAMEGEATSYEAEAGLKKQESEQAKQAGPIAETASLLGSASSVTGQLYKYWSSGDGAFAT